MLYLQLFISFFTIGLFGFGGGYAMLSMIQNEVVVKHAWIDVTTFTDIVAISQMTPGPIGINSATYCGYSAALNAGYGHGMAVLGSITATLALILPSFIIMLIFCKLYTRLSDNRYMTSSFTVLRPVVVGLIASAALLLMNSENFSTPDDTYRFGVSIALFGCALIASLRKVHPILLIVIAAIAGIVIF